jgi:hypothetical protein
VFCFISKWWILFHNFVAMNLSVLCLLAIIGICCTKTNWWILFHNFVAMNLSVLCLLAIISICCMKKNVLNTWLCVFKLIMCVIFAHLDYNSWFLVSTWAAPLQLIVYGLLVQANAMIAGLLVQANAMIVGFHLSGSPAPRFHLNDSFPFQAMHHPCFSW